MDTNLHVLFFITPGFIKRCLVHHNYLANNPPPEGLDLERFSHLSLVPILWGFKRYQEACMNLPICKYILYNLQAEFVTEFAKRNISENVVVYSLLIILSKNEEVLQRSLTDILPNERDALLSTDYDRQLFRENIASVRQFLSLVHVQIHTDIREKNIITLERIIEIFSTLKKVISDELEFKLNTRSRELGFIQPYLSLHWRKRIYLFSYLPNAKQFLSLLNSSFPVKLNLVEKGRHEKSVILWDEWLDLCSYLPKTWTPLADESLNRFKQLLYETNVFPSEKMKNLVPSNYQHPILLPPEKNTLLLQMLAMQMKNWRVLWFRSNWPRDEDIVKRLHFIREVEHFECSPRDLLRLGFGQAF